MTDTGFPELPGARPLWLVTLADLALLLVGFFVLLQATQNMDRGKLAQGIRRGFAGVDAPPPSPAPMPVAADGVMDFAVGAAALPASAAPLLAWARDAARDPRVVLTITGQTDGSAIDVDAATGSATILATDRARAVAAALATAAPAAPSSSPSPSRAR